MSEQTTIGGRGATIAYLTRSFEPATPETFEIAKVIFDDGDVVFLTAPPHDNSAGDGEAVGFGRHRDRQARPFKHAAPDAGDAEMAGFSRHRGKHMQAILVMLAGDLADEPAVDPSAEDAPVKIHLVAWAKALAIIDASEILVRDLIERELAGKTGDMAAFRPLAAIKSADALATQVKTLRDAAIKSAFRALRDRLGDKPVLDVSFARWAQYFSAIDHKQIKMAIQAGLAEGVDSTEIARKVVGSLSLDGVDGVTQFTRHKLAHLGRAAIRARQGA